MPGPVPDDSASASGWVLGALCHPARIDATPPESMRPVRPGSMPPVRPGLPAPCALLRNRLPWCGACLCLAA
jgi:hypothetical protein